LGLPGSESTFRSEVRGCCIATWFWEGESKEASGGEAGAEISKFETKHGVVDKA